MKKLKNIDSLILINVIILTLIGLMMVYSASSIWANYVYSDKYYYFKRQLIFIILGLILMIFMYKLKLSIIRKYSKILLIIGFLMLILVLIPGIGAQVNGSRSWFKIASFMIQPAEIFKLIIVIFMADRLDKYYLQTSSFIKTITILLIPSILGFLLIMLQPDFGTGVVMLGSIIMMCIISKNKFKNYLFIMSLAIIGFAIIIATSAYRSERILAYIDPYSDPLGSGFQAIQSLYAIGPGGLLGKGFDSSYQKYYYLPEPQTDFIFSIYAEDYGLIGCIILILLYTSLIFLLLKKSANELRIFKCYLNVGISSLIIIQVCINLCVVVGLIPVTGITLPFMSYGGSSITVLLAGIGLILNKGDKNEHIDVR